MKKSNYILLFLYVLIGNLVQAQEEKESIDYTKKESKFNITAYGGIGYGIIENDNEPNYNLNSDGGDILLNYRINQNFGIAAGIGLYELTGNGFNSIGDFYHERTILKIPLVATMDYTITDKVRLLANFGFYAQNITRDEYRFLNSSQKDIYEGWNTGIQLNIGFLFELINNFSAGINYNGMGDLGSIKTNNNQVINDKQKLKNLNSIGIIFMVEL